MQKFLYTALFTMGMFAVVASTVSAKVEVLGEQSQSQKAEQTIKCNPGERKITIDSYGVTKEEYIGGNCEGSQTVEQSQSQKILGYSTDGNKIHYPVDTALDETTMAAAIGLAVVGGLAFAAKRRLA